MFVVHIREVLMCVLLRRMSMRMRMPRAGRNVFPVLMLVMGIVLVPMVVDGGLVRMLMQVPLSKVQPHTRRHEYAGYREFGRDRLRQER